MIINSSNLNLITQAINLRFLDEYKKVLKESLDYVGKVATIVQSSTREEVYPVVAEIPQLREWTGDRIAHDVATYDYSLANKDFELTIKLDRNKVEDDQYGVWMATVVPMIAQQAKRKPSLLVRDAMRSGQSVDCYDGQSFFDASHPVSKFPGSGVSGTQQNYWSSGKALTHANYQSVRSAMMGYKGESGESLGTVPNLLVLPPQLEDVGRAILHADFIAPQTIGGVTQVGSNTNIYKGSAEPLVLPDLAADATTWYLLDTSGGINPFIYQERKAPVIVPLFNPTDEGVYRRKEFEWGVDMRGAAGYGHWFKAAKAVA